MSSNSYLKKEPEQEIESFYALKLSAFWGHMKNEHFSFWMICGYLICEYFRPQSIFPALDFLPWAQLFIVLSATGALLDKSSKWVRDPANVWITIFLIVIVAASAFAEYPAVAWRQFNYFFSWYLIYFLIVNIVNSERRLLIFLSIFLLASFKLSFFGAKVWTLRGFSFTTWGIQGPPGYFTNSGELSIQMLMFSPVAYHLAIFLRPYISNLKFYVLLLMPITGVMTVIGASSRGSQIALVYQFYRSLLKGRLSVKNIVAVCVVGWLAFSVLPAEQKARFMATGEDRTSQQRILYWQHGVEMIKEHPFLGVGFFNFPDYYQAHYPQDVLFGAAQVPHNIFVQVGTDAGLLGLGCFLMLLYRNAKTAREIVSLDKSNGNGKRSFAALAKGLSVAMWGFVIAGQFVTVAYYPFIWINLAMTVALGNIARRELANHAPVTTNAALVAQVSLRKARQ